MSSGSKNNGSNTTGTGETEQSLDDDDRKFFEEFGRTRQPNPADKRLKVGQTYQLVNSKLSVVPVYSQQEGDNAYYLELVQVGEACILLKVPQENNGLCQIFLNDAVFYISPDHLLEFFAKEQLL